MNARAVFSEPANFLNAIDVLNKCKVFSFSLPKLVRALSRSRAMAVAKGFLQRTLDKVGLQRTSSA